MRRRAEPSNRQKSDSQTPDSQTPDRQKLDRQKLDRQTKDVIEAICDTDDPRKAWGAVKRRMVTLRAEGREIPEALWAAERNLMTELTAASQGR
jgi:hypothetical protein